MFGPRETAEDKGTKVVKGCLWACFWLLVLAACLGTWAFSRADTRPKPSPVRERQALPASIAAGTAFAVYPLGLGDMRPQPPSD